MSYFSHSPDNKITINDGSNSLTMPLATFVIMEPDYALPTSPAGIVWQYYQPGVKYEIHTVSRQYDGGIPWSDGDIYISRLSTYINQYKNPTLDLGIAKNIKHAELYNIYAAKLAGGLNLFSTVMPSRPSITDEVLAYNTAGSVPTGFYLPDSTGTPVFLNLTQLNTYQNGIAQIRWTVRQNNDILSTEINDAATVVDVEAIDLTVGWPSLPYTPT